ncbi:MAG: helix-turn-helix domain-containing protein [Verrucomicrobiota bacterium]|jgi:DNA-binding transcriptional ArsR family regulator
MSDSFSKASSVAGGLPAAPSIVFDNPVKLLHATAEPLRWAILGELATGQPLSVQELGTRLQRRPNLVSKHLRVLREAGAVVVVPALDDDGRKQFYAVPEEFRHVDDSGRPVLDYGVCALRVFPGRLASSLPAAPSDQRPTARERPATTAGLDVDQSGWID